MLTEQKAIPIGLPGLLLENTKSLVWLT